MNTNKPYFRGIEDNSREPIRVFGEKVCFAFENIRQELSKEYPGQLDKLNLNVLISSEKVKGPFCTDSQIHLHDVFLSYLWCHIYGLIALAPIGEKSLTQQEDEAAREILQHAQDILSFYRKWNTSKLPNPEVYGADGKQLVGVTNACFWYAINYILYHEFAHKVLGHVDVIQKIRNNNLEPSKDLQNKFEKEADLFALEKMMGHELVKGTTHVFSVQIGILAALSSIMFTSNNSHGGKSHPDPDYRIRYTLEHINPQENDYIWAFGFWIFITWEQYNNAWFKLWPTGNTEDSLKEKFYETLKLMEQIKNERQ